jgi:hypothetical protein
LEYNGEGSEERIKRPVYNGNVQRYTEHDRFGH